MGRNFPDSGLMRLIRTGQVRINKKRCRPFDRICTGDLVRIPPYSPVPDQGCSFQGSLDIIYENKEFLAVNKPGGLPVHGGTGHQDSLAARVAWLYQDSEFKPAPVHRLDKNTTGLVLFARTYSWLRRIQDIWKTSRLEKNYLAWVKGEWKGGPGLVRDNLVRHSDRVRAASQGKPAVSWVAPVLKKQGMTLLMIRLETGRTHQIRVQLGSRGLPVMGDVKYGGTTEMQDQMFLHCFRLSWPGHEILAAPDWKYPFKVPGSLPHLPS